MDHSELQTLLNHYSLTLKEVAEIVGRPYNSVRNMLRPGCKVPNWLNLSLHIYRMENPVNRYTAINESLEFIELPVSVSNYDQAKTWVANHLDLSKNWRIEKGQLKQIEK